MLITSAPMARAPKDLPPTFLASRLHCISPGAKHCEGCSRPSESSLCGAVRVNVLSLHLRTTFLSLVPLARVFTYLYSASSIVRPNMFVKSRNLTQADCTCLPTAEPRCKCGSYLHRARSKRFGNGRDGRVLGPRSCGHVVSLICQWNRNYASLITSLWRSNSCLCNRYSHDGSQPPPTQTIDPTYFKSRFVSCLTCFFDFGYPTIK